jgi:general secretion pathway protein I
MIRSPARRYRASAKRRAGEHGFALLEILVAFVILAIGLGGMLVGVSVAMRSDARTQMNRTAVQVAQSRLEAAGMIETLVPGRLEGRSGNRYSWQQTVTAVQSAAAPGDQAGVKQRSPASSSVFAYWVEVAVQAEDGAIAKLAALKLAPAAKP